MRYLVIGSAVFFALAILVGAFVALRGGNRVSSDLIDLVATGPVSVKAGEELTLAVALTNRNPTALELAELTVTFPEGTRSVADQTKDLPRTRESIGTIPSGGTAVKTIRAVLYGEEGEEKEIQFALQYRTAGSNAVFEKTKSILLPLSSSNVAVQMRGPLETNAGAEIALEFRVVSNALAPVRNALLAVTYPPGFLVSTAEPSATFGTRVWRLGDLAPGAEKVIRVRGRLEGADNEVKGFRAAVGSASVSEESEIGTPYASLFKTITVRRPFVDLDFLLAGSAEHERAVAGGAELNSSFRITNNLAEPIRDLVVEVSLAGSALDLASVRPDDSGFYDSSARKLVWDRNSAPKLAELAPGEQFEGEFRLTARAGTDATQSLTLALTGSGRRIRVDASPEPISFAAERIAKVGSELGLVARALYSTGAFTNAGPIPPRADKETSYTLALAVTNSTNPVTRGELTFSLPLGVRWAGVVAPVGEAITYNDETRTVRWAIGAIPAGTGFRRAPREASVQLILKPSLDQVDREVSLTGDIMLTGTDQFTGVALTSIKRGGVTTAITTDPAYRAGDGAVGR